MMGYSASYKLPNIVQYLCEYLRDISKYTCSDTLPQDLDSNRRYVIITELPSTRGNLPVGNPTVVVQLLGKPSDGVAGEMYDFAEEILEKIQKVSGLEINGPVTSVNSIFGPTKNILYAKRPHWFYNVNLSVVGQ